MNFGFIGKWLCTYAETCLSAFQDPLDPITALGGFSGNKYSEASAFIVTYPVNNAVDDVGNENGKALAWEKAFIQLAKDELLPMVLSRNLSLSFSAESSTEEELKRESTADVMTIIGDAPQISSFYLLSKVLLGLPGVLLVMLSVLGSVGFFSAVRVKSTLIIMEVIPCLVLAVGVDNMCILVYAITGVTFRMTMGSFIPMPACRVFSMFAVTAFVALIYLRELRMAGLIVFLA